MRKSLVHLSGITLILFILTGCSGRNNNDNTGQDQVINGEAEISRISSLPELASLNGDTINIYGKYVLFYGPDAESMAEDSELQIFMERSSKIINDINAQGNIPASYTTVNHIRIFTDDTGKSMVVSRKTFPENMGFLITDGSQPPKLRNGLITEEEYYEMIRGYFFIPT